ncbi:ABC transporter substrate-binding protein [Dietzia kunjamensis]|uniref:ABC transporter substrate-binding protein n=1 Tax=Dietzia kunjamensis TaxID=322509 RepID=UPI00336813FB
MRFTRSARIAAAAIASTLVLGACGGRDDAGSGEQGISDDEILLGTSLAQSGPLSVYGDHAKAIEAYFNHINETEGGIDGRKIRLITYDDAFDPSRTLENVRRLNEQDKVFAIVGVVGTQPNLGIVDYAGQQEVPNIFMAAGTAELTKAEEYPFTVPWLPPYPIEGEIAGRFLAKENPDATVAVLARDDDGGSDWMDGFRKGIEGTNIRVVAEQSIAVDAAQVDSEMASLAATNADVFLNINNPKQASQAIGYLATSPWDPEQFVASYASSIESTLKPVGLENAVGVTSTQYMKDPSDPNFADDEGVKNYLSYMEQFAPGVNAMDLNTAVSGASGGQMVVEALKRMEEPTRESLMAAVESMQDVEIDMLLPGVDVTVSDADHAAVECLQMQRFDGKRYELVGDVICADD